jgi:hypothetical protein
MRTSFALAILALVLVSVPASAQTTDCPGCAGVSKVDAFTRLGVHAADVIRKDDAVGIAGWAELWKAGLSTAQPHSKEFLISGGPRFKNDFWRLETLAGAFIRDGEARPLIDIRVSAGSYFYKTEPALALGDPIYVKFTGNYQYRFRKGLAPPEHMVRAAYDFVQYEWLAFGGETENIIIPNGECIYTAGPRIVFPIGKRLQTEAAYLFRYAGRNEVWVRAHLHF